MKRGGGSRLCGVLALQGPRCCCCRGTVRLSKPEKSHGFGPAAAWDGSLSLQVWSSEWGMTAVFHSWPALLSLFLSPLLSFHVPPFIPQLFLSWEMTKTSFLPLTHTYSQPPEFQLDSAACSHSRISMRVLHNMWALLHLRVGERVFCECPGGCQVGWRVVFARWEMTWGLKRQRNCVTDGLCDKVILGARLWSVEVWH